MENLPQKCRLDPTIKITCRLCRLAVPCDRAYTLENLGTGNRSAVICLACSMQMGRLWDRIVRAV